MFHVKHFGVCEGWFHVKHFGVCRGSVSRETLGRLRAAGRTVRQLRRGSWTAGGFAARTQAAAPIRGAARRTQNAPEGSVCRWYRVSRNGGFLGGSPPGARSAAGAGCPLSVSLVPFCTSRKERLRQALAGNVSRETSQAKPSQPHSGGLGFCRRFGPSAPMRLPSRFYVLINPLPKISLELVTRMKAWGSADLRYSRRATAWDRDRAVSTIHFGSWE